MPKVKVKQPDDAAKEVPAEVLATSIAAIAEGVRKLRAGRLNDKALFLLIQHAAPTTGGKYSTSPVSIRDIKAIFEGIESLESTYLKKPTRAA